MASKNGNGVYRLGQIRFDPERMLATAGNGQLDLAWRHKQALRLLVEADGQVVPKEEFFRQIWPEGEVDESNLTHCITQLRRVLKEAGADHLETVPRVGYRLVVHDQPPDVVEPVQVRRRWIIPAVVIAVIGIAAAVLGYGAWKRNQQIAEAERAYVEGRRLRARNDPSAVELYREAVRLNPGKAAYHAALAEGMTRLGGSARPDWKFISQIAERGVQLDPNCSECKAHAGMILFTRMWEWDKAGPMLESAVTLAPQSAGWHGYLAMYLAGRGRLPEAADRIEQGLKVDPYLGALHEIKTAVLYFSRRYDDSLAAAARGVSLGRSPTPFNDWRSYSLFQSGRAEEALTVASTHWPQAAEELERLQRSRGTPAALRRLLDMTEGDTARITHFARRAHWKVLLGDRDGAMDELEFGADKRGFPMIYTGVDPMLQTLRSGPRFQALLRRLNLQTD